MLDSTRLEDHITIPWLDDLLSCILSLGIRYAQLICSHIEMKVHTNGFMCHRTTVISLQVIVDWWHQLWYYVISLNCNCSSSYTGFEFTENLPKVFIIMLIKVKYKMANDAIFSSAWGLLLHILNYIFSHLQFNPFLLVNSNPFLSIHLVYNHI